MLSFLYAVQGNLRELQQKHNRFHLPGMKGKAHMPIYNKLVRDLIPDIILESGKEPITSILTDEEYVAALRNKLDEEIREYLSAANDNDALEELADILEIVGTLATVHGSSLDDVLLIKTEKNRARGGFEKKTFIIEVKDES